MRVFRVTLEDEAFVPEEPDDVVRVVVVVVLVMTFLDSAICVGIVNGVVNEEKTRTEKESGKKIYMSCEVTGSKWKQYRS